APAQGALAVEATVAALGGASDASPAWFGPRMAAVDDPVTRAAVTAERALLRALEAGCSAPVGAYGEVLGDQLQLRALAIRPDGSHVVEGSARVGFDPAEDAASGPDSLPFHLGTELAEDLLARGAGQILAEAKA